MRELTYQEQTALANGRTILFTEIDGTELDNLTLLLINNTFRDGFIAGLDHAAGEVKRLRAENDRLRAALSECAHCGASAMSLYCTACGVSTDTQVRQALKGER